jgi:hypothetical protein
MRHLGSAAALTALASTWLLACDPTVELPDTGYSFLRDGGVDPPPAAPQVDPPPPTTPYDLLTLRGVAEGRRVIITGTYEDDEGKTVNVNPEAVTLGIGGEFCADLRLPAQSVYSFQLQAYGADNQVGAPLAAPIRVRYDKNAPALPEERTCAGVLTQGCSETVEICGDGRDNDCNGLADAMDPVCSTCADDQLEPNDSADAPRIQPGVYNNLQICPGDPDYYGVYLRRGERLDAQALFDHAEGDLDLDLLGVDGSTVLTRSATTESTETVIWTATAAGAHVLVVYGSQSTANGYRLRVEIFGN